MPVPTTLSDLSTTIGSNYPTGGETVGTNMDDYLRAHAGLIAQVNNNKQDADADLTAIAALSPSNDDIIQRKAGAWTNRTISQLKTDLAYGSAAALDVGTSANKVVQLDSSAKLPAVDGSQLTNLTVGVGVGQTWQVVTRTSGTTYYNTTGKPITLVVSSTANGALSVSVNGVAAKNATNASSWPEATVIIPPDASYVITCGVVYNTSELR